LTVLNIDDPIVGYVILEARLALNQWRRSSPMLSPSEPHRNRQKARRLRDGMKRDVAALRGQGISQEKVGRVLGISQQAVAKIEKSPDVREAIARGRLIWRSVAAEEAENLARPIWGMAKDCIEKGDSKGLDNTARGVDPVWWTPIL
jgi:DNA-binding XRE family transcriptional regulator